MAPCLPCESIGDGDVPSTVFDLFRSAITIGPKRRFRTSAYPCGLLQFERSVFSVLRVHKTLRACHVLISGRVCMLIAPVFLNAGAVSFEYGSVTIDGDANFTDNTAWDSGGETSYSPFVCARKWEATGRGRYVDRSHELSNACHLR